MLAGVFLTVHTPPYCTLEAAFEVTLASEVFGIVLGARGFLSGGGAITSRRPPFL